jgi:acetyltransferase-like isoleucine patch superfamily enzyme
VEDSSATVELVSGIDGTVDFSRGAGYFAGTSGNQTNRGLYAWRAGGSTIAVGTEVVVRIHNVLLPTTPGPFTLTHVVHRPHPTNDYLTGVALSFPDVLTFELAEGASCAAGLDPVDTDLDSIDDSCIAPDADVDASVMLAPGVIIHPGGVVRPGASVGAGTGLEEGVYISHGAVVGVDSTIGAGTVIGRRAPVGDRTVLGADSSVARSARTRRCRQTVLLATHPSSVMVSSLMGASRSLFGGTTGPW